MSRKRCGIKGRFTIHNNEYNLKCVQDGADFFLNEVKDNILDCSFDIYTSVFEDNPGEEYITVDFDILNVSSKACKGDLSTFKKLLKECLNLKFDNSITISYDKVF